VRPFSRRGALVRGLVVAALAIGVVGPVPGSAQVPAQTPAQTPEQQRDEVRRQAAEAALQIDAMRAEEAVIQQALADIQANVTAQQADVDAATLAQQAADAAVAEADAAVAAAEQQVADLQVATDALLVDAFVDPPINHALDIFRSGSLSDAAVKQAILKIQADDDAALMEQLTEAEANLEVERAAKEEAAALAASRKAESEAALAELQTAQAQQQQLAADLEERLNTRLAEAESLRQQDATLSAQIEAEQAALAARLAAIAPAPGGTVTAPDLTVPGGLATVGCPTGGSITIAGEIADELAALLAAAEADGVILCGGGYRDPQAQIDLRREHCGTSDYAIYQMPASQCSPPTARPGTSQHEVGLAVDFTCNGGGTVTRSSSCFTWLSAHADEYGLYNLPEEPWHWSTTGR
jgi:LAS superfamily LD-carboxypeptidase LdcB